MRFPKSLWLVLFLFFVFCSPMIFAGSLKEKIIPLIQREWQKIKEPDSPSGPPFWNYRVSLGYPCIWPVKGSVSLCYYAFAYAFDPQVADGERIAAPWARIVVDPAEKNDLTIEFLSKEINKIGIQGMRPLKAEEMQVYKNADRVEEALV